jgi:hypothetical protein
VLDVVACVGLMLFARAFGADTPQTRSRARVVMNGVYLGIALLGGFFLYVGLSASPAQYRTVVQALIFITLGAGGLVFNRKGTTA